MTLKTSVYVLDQTDPRELFQVCLSLLAKHDEQQRTPEDVTVIEGSDAFDQHAYIATRIGQGLPAILRVLHRGAAPLVTAEAAAAHDSDCDEDCDSENHAQPRWLEVSFDSTYGIGPGKLHMALVSALGLSLDSFGVRWSWRNEYTGDVHSGPDPYQRLVDLTKYDG